MRSRASAPDLTGRLAGLQREWDRLGRANPKWAVCTTKRDRHWDDAELFATGTQEIDELLAYVDVRAPGLRRDAALDFGCGVGRLTRALAPHFERVVGVDVAPSMIAEARRLNEGHACRFVVNDTPDLARFDDAGFDLVYSTMVFQHMAPSLMAAYLVEFRRVLRRDGAAVFTMTSEPGHTWRGRGWRWLPRPLINAYKRRHDGADAVMEMHGILPDAMRRMLGECGFSVADVQPSDVGAPDWLAFRYLARPAN